MKKEYTIKEGHPVLEVIRQEIIKSDSYYSKDIIGISSPSIHDRALCSTDVYGFRFNCNNWDVLTINLCTWLNPKSELAPPILSEMIGYDYYGTSRNVSLKLKTFLEKNPEFSDISEWAEPVTHIKENLRYYGHNTEEKRFSVEGIKGVSYEISFPENATDDRNILEWSKPACESLTKSHWREVALDKTFNILRDRRVAIEASGSGWVWFSYDYNDGLVEVYDACASNRASSSSIWSAFELSNPKPETLDKIKEEIETGDLEVKEVRFVKKEVKKTRFKYEDLVG